MGVLGVSADLVELLLELDKEHNANPSAGLTTLDGYVGTTLLYWAANKRGIKTAVRAQRKQTKQRPMMASRPKRCCAEQLNATKIKLHIRNHNGAVFYWYRLQKKKR